MNEKLVERLKRGAQHDGHSSDWWVEYCRTIHEAATALPLAQARIRELETALEPFANDWRAFPGCDPDGEPTKVTVADFKRARQTLKEASE